MRAEGTCTANGPCNESFDYTSAMEYLVHVVQDLSLARDLNGLMDIVRRAARRLTGADGATFVLRDGDYCFYADEDAIEPLWKGRRFPLGDCVSGWAMENRAQVAIEDVYADPRIPKDVYRSTFVCSLVMVPIRMAHPVGAIGNYWAHRHKATAEQVRILQALADTTAVALENVHLYASLEKRVKERTAELEAANEEIHRLSLTDELTGLQNRRGFMLLAEQLIRSARRSKSLVWLMFADLDGLKPINDQLGHEAGNKLLRAAANVLRETFRELDVVARIGGDEFAVLGTGEHVFQDLPERLQAGIDRYNEKRICGPALSMSVGLVHSDLFSQLTLDELLSKADEAMYADKRERTAKRMVAAVRQAK